jgi:hypothetical protein
MEDEVKELVFNMMCDMKKHELEPIGRAKLIQNYLEQTGLTGRMLAKRIGVPHSTLQDWLLWSRITKDQYDKHIQEGHSHLDIYKSLRGGTLGGKLAIDLALQNCISKLEVFKLKPPTSKDTKLLIGKLRHILTVIEAQTR